MINPLGQVVDGEAPDRPDAVVLTQLLLEGHRQTRFGGDRHTGARAGAQTVEPGWTGLLGRLSAAAMLVVQHWGPPSRTEPHEEETMQTRETSANATHGMQLTGQATFRPGPPSSCHVAGKQALRLFVVKAHPFILF